MDPATIIGLVGSLAGLAERMYADLSAADQAKFETEWNAMRVNVQQANAEWVAAGGATGVPTQLPGS